MHTAGKNQLPIKEGIFIQRILHSKCTLKRMPNSCKKSVRVYTESFEYYLLPLHLDYKDFYLTHQSTKTLKTLSPWNPSPS
jgi:hypothetical protein